MSFGAPGEVSGAARPAGGPRPPGGLRPALAAEVVDDARGFDALARAWDTLLARSDASVFQSFEWLRTWWRHFGEGRADVRLHLVTVREGDDLVAVAPLYVDRAPVLGPLRLRRLLFVGHRASDYLDALAVRGLEAPCAEAIAGALAEGAPAFDVAVLEETPDGSRLGPLLQAALLRRGWSARRAVEGPCPRTALAPTWEATLAAFRIEHRREARRRLRNLGKEHAVELEVVEPGAAVRPAMREFVEMHQERWARDGYWGAFADPAEAAFHADAAEALARRGWLHLAFLRVDGRRLAVNYGFAFRDAVAIYLTGARAIPPDLRRHSPGRSLHALCMQWGIGRGCTVYDFMRGAEPYKYELGAVDVPNWTLVAYPRRPRLIAAVLALHALRARARRRLGRELHALRVARGGEGWLSPGVRAHLARAVRRGLGDLRRALGRRSRREEAP